MVLLCRFAGKIRSSTREETRNAQLSWFHAMEKSSHTATCQDSSCQEEEEDKDKGGITTIDRRGEMDHRHDQPNNSKNDNNGAAVVQHVVNDGNADDYENSICFSLSNVCAGLFRNHRHHHHHHRSIIDEDGNKDKNDSVRKQA